MRLLDDLTARHRRAARVPVETYLERLAGLAAEREVVLDLLVAEWTLRRQAGEAVALAEYVQRFPQWEQDVRMWWGADQQSLPPFVEPPPAAAVDLRLPEWYVGAAAFPVAFGAYRLVQEFGGGGMARVFLAEPLAGGTAVALKVPKLPSGQDANEVAERSSLRQRFLREVRLTLRLNHPRLCRALDVGESDGLPYFTMPYYPGGSVGAELQTRGRFSERDAARLTADVARALQHAHDLGILHRDLKPSNLLRDAQGQVVVTDFGLGFPLEEEGQRLTSAGKVLGTPLYLSPEQACGERDLTPASDIFSLGVVLYELLAGKRPFEGNLYELLVAIPKASPVPLEERRPDVSLDLAAICRRAMAREPGDRYPSMAAFADDLERFLAGTWTPPPEPPKPLPATLLTRVARSRRARRRRWAAGVGVGVTVLLVCWALSAFLGGNVPPPPNGKRPVVSTRQPIGLRGQLQLLHDDLGKLDAAVRPHVRYFSLMAVHDNPYVSDADLGLHLDALRRVLNRLSKDKLNVPVNRVDAAGCLLRIDLRDLAWDADNEWTDLLKVEPYGVRYDAVHPDEALRKLARATYDLALCDAPCVRADWFIEAATRAPLFDHLQQIADKERRTPPFDAADANDPVVRVVQLYQANPVDGRVAAAELGLGTVAELDARWPADKPDLRNALNQPLPRSRWAGEDGYALFADYVRTLKLGVPRATQPLR
jgi:serine/threonine protein kinase